ncbi:dihydrofolate synthase / folylpolyglutamate synthase [Dehalogenimonas formicexedens]|uniref:tetrahydrofolate synthase n=1 Tax=Dehalogenimonas formicexedens TaxID=1839801 RepID=A0A1P8F4Q3_9CHLR|nr:folylpolyglutamate synthase/dihydrofolate synthase family protein [Dehalogenimonas formicexedens]APV43410.1 dihydrofolate synthase / folylpolyglutamate synthase [Dehalogenimonas formicexedens]
MKAEYHAALDWLYSFVDYEAGQRPRDESRYDLRRVKLFLERLGNPHLKARTVHIAGSKGKGSTAAMIFAVLREAGYKTGLYTSPHLIETYERFKIGDHFIGEDEFIVEVQKLKPIVAEINDQARYGELTTFEIMTVLAFDYFANNKVDWQVIEVGLGGRLDATNVVEPNLSIITTINLEHTDVLGDTIKEIASEKAGIIKAGVPVVSAPQGEDATGVIRSTCHKIASPLRVASIEAMTRSSFNGGFQMFNILGRHNIYDIKLPLLGTYQRINCAVAVAALEALIDQGVEGITKETVERGLSRTDWPGRFQVIDRGPLVIVDGAHNPASSMELVNSLDAFLDADMMPHPAVLVIAASADKDVTGMAEVLAPVFDEFVVTRTRHPRGMDVKILGRAFEELGRKVNYTSTTAEALVFASQLAGSEGLVCVTGSLFAVGEALEIRPNRAAG